MKKPATFIVVILLGFVAAAHLLRLVFGVEIMVAGRSVPFWPSALGFLVPAILAILVWRERK